MCTVFIHTPVLLCSCMLVRPYVNMAVCWLLRWYMYASMAICLQYGSLHTKLVWPTYLYDEPVIDNHQSEQGHWEKGKKID